MPLQFVWKNRSFYEILNDNAIVISCALIRHFEVSNNFHMSMEKFVQNNIPIWWSMCTFNVPRQMERRKLYACIVSSFSIKTTQIDTFIVFSFPSHSAYCVNGKKKYMQFPGNICVVTTKSSQQNICKSLVETRNQLQFDIIFGCLFAYCNYKCHRLQSVNCFKLKIN